MEELGGIQTPACCCDPEKTDNAANRSLSESSEARNLHLQNHLMLHLLVQRLGTGWLGKSPAGREGGRPRVAVPGWMPSSRGDALHSGVGAAARPAERGMPLFPAAWSWEGHTVSSWGRPHLGRLPRSRRTLRNWGETHKKLPELCDLQGETQAC